MNCSQCIFTEDCTCLTVYISLHYPLVMQYKKPDDILKLEKELQAELKKLKAEKEGDVECNQS